jgi:hypothetical protein
MNSDIRIKTSFPNHPKTKKFIKTVGPTGGWMLTKLWVFTAQNKPDGHLTNMDASDICDVMEFKGNPRMMIHALLDCTFGADSMRSCPGCDVCERGKNKKRAAWLEKTSTGFYRVHDWEEHNPYASKAPARIDRAKKGAATRIENLLKQRLGVSLKQEQDELSNDNSSAPAPAPAPSPAPSPLERSGKPNRSNATLRRVDEIAFEEAKKAWTIFEEIIRAPMQEKFVISDPRSRKIAIDLGGQDRLIELISHNGDQLRNEFIARYAVLEKADYKVKSR